MRPLIHNRRGGAAAVVLTVLLILAVAGALFWFAENRQAGKSATALELAEKLPFDVFAVWATDLRGDLDLSSLALDIKAINSKFPPQDQIDFKKLESELRMAPHDWIGMFDSRVAMVWLKTTEDAQDPAFYLLVGLADHARFSAWWSEQQKQYQKSKGQEATVEGLTFHSYGQSAWVGHDEQWLYVAGSQDHARKAIMAARGAEKATLSENPRFKEGLEKLDVQRSNGFFFLDIAAVNGKIKEWSPPYTDVRTFNQLAPLQYFIANGNLAESQTDALLRIEGESDLSKALLTPGRLQAADPARFSKVSAFNSLDVRWLIDLVVALSDLTPDTRAYTGLINLGLKSQGDPWEAFTGTILAGGNFEEGVPALLAAYSTPSEGQAVENQASNVTILPALDAGKAYELLNKLLQLGGEPPQKGKETTYPVAALDLDLLISAQEKPSVMLLTGPKAKALVDSSQGTTADLEAVKEALAWAGKDGIVYLDYLNLQPLYDTVQKELDKSTHPQAAGWKMAANNLWTRFERLDGSSALVTRPYGLQYRATGTSSVGVAAAVGIFAAIVTPNFLQARDDGQLTACKSNQKNVATALEMYATDHAGDYPKSLSLLTPDYLKTLPECPVAGRDSYSESYKVQTSGADSSTIYPFFEFGCSGPNHQSAGLPANYPRYNGNIGLIERP